MTAGDAEFVDFAAASALRLRRTAFLLCHDWHTAEDLTQTALAKTYVAWRRVRATGNPEAYTRKILLRSFLDQQRRRSSTELVLPVLPESGWQEHSELRLTLLEALRRLPHGTEPSSSCGTGRTTAWRRRPICWTCRSPRSNSRARARWRNYASCCRTNRSLSSPIEAECHLWCPSSRSR